MEFGSEIGDNVGYLDEQKEEDGEKTEDDISEIIRESDELDNDLPEIFGESDELDDDLPEDSNTDKLNDFDPSLDFDEMENYDFDGNLDFSEIDEFNEENKSLSLKNNEWCEIDWNEVNSDKREESIWSEINWNDEEIGDQEESVWTKIDWEETEREKKTEFDSNNENGEFVSKQLDSNEVEHNYEGNELEQSEMRGDNDSNYEPYEFGDDFDQEEYSGGFYENSYAEAMNTILLSEDQIYEYLQEYIQLMGEKENEVNQGEKAEVDNSKEEVSELEKFLEEERERIRLEQQQADLDEVMKADPKSELEVNEEEVEQEQKENLDTQENISKETFSNNERELEEELQLNSVDEFQVDQEETIDHKQITNEEEIENQKLELEELESNSIEEKLEEQVNDDNEKYEIFNEEELGHFREEREGKEEYEELKKDHEIPPVAQELEVTQDTNTNEIEISALYQEEEIEYEISSPYKGEEHKDIEEFKEPHQELEENLEQNRKMQQTLLEIEKEEIDSDKPPKGNYERTKKLYHLQTGKRPIYANKETKGFKEWLEQIKELGGKQKGEQSKEQEREQENEEEWILFLKNWINEKSEEKINPQTKNQLIQIIEKYNELDELTKSFKELYGKMRLRQLSQTEIMKLEILIKTLQKSDPSNILLFINLPAIKNYLTHQKLDSVQINQMLKHFFTQFPPLKQLNRILTQKHKSYTTIDLINNLLQIVLDFDVKFEKSITEEISKDQTVKNWKEVLKENLYKITMFSLNEKSIIIKIIKKAKLDEDDKKQLISILSNLPTKDLISLLGNDFENQIRNFVNWGWVCDLGLKRLMLKEFLKRMNISHRDINNSFDVKAHGKTEKIKTKTQFYSVAEFFRDLKREIRRITGQKITYRTLSKNFLKMKNKWVINDKILHSKDNPDYVIDAILLSSYERTIKSKLGKNFQG